MMGPRLPFGSGGHGRTEPTVTVWPTGPLVGVTLNPAAASVAGVDCPPDADGAVPAPAACDGLPLLLRRTTAAIAATIAIAIADARSTGAHRRFDGAGSG